MLNLTMFLIHFLGQPLATAKTWAGSSPPATAEQSSGLWKVWQSHPRAMAPQHRWPCQDIIFCSVGIVNDLTSPLHMLNATENTSSQSLKMSQYCYTAALINAQWLYLLKRQPSRFCMVQSEAMFTPQRAGKQLRGAWFPWAWSLTSLSPVPPVLAMNQGRARGGADGL